MMQATESSAVMAGESGAELAPSVPAASTSSVTSPSPSGGVEMRPLPDMPASAPFWYQVPRLRWARAVELRLSKDAAALSMSAVVVLTSPIRACVPRAVRPAF